MALIKTLFLAGDYWPQILRANADPALYALILILVARRTLAKRLD